MKDFSLAKYCFTTPMMTLWFGSDFSGCYGCNTLSPIPAVARTIYPGRTEVSFPTVSDLRRTWDSRNRLYLVKIRLEVIYVITNTKNKFSEKIMVGNWDFGLVSSWTLKMHQIQSKSNQIRSFRRMGRTSWSGSEQDLSGHELTWSKTDEKLNSQP